MIRITTASLFFLAAGILTSVSILSIYQVLFVVPLIYFSYVSLKNGNTKLPKSAWFLLSFALVAFISLILNYELLPKPSKNFGRIKYFLFGVGGIFVFKFWLEQASDKVKKLLTNTFFLSIIIAAVYAIYSFIVSPIGRGKGLTETMRYGYGSGMILLTLLSAILQHKKIGKWFNPKIAFVIFVIGFLGMYFTYTRGALLGFLSGLPFVVYFYRKKMGIIIGACAVGVVFTLIGFYLFGSGNYNSRFLVNKNNSSDTIRRSQWKAGIIATQEKPILGWGLSNFHSQLKRIKTEYDLDAKHYDDAHSHNLFIEVSSGTGIIGLFFFLGWIISWAIESYKTSQLTRALVVPFGVAFVVSSQFEVTFDANNASMIFMLYALSTANHVMGNLKNEIAS